MTTITINDRTRNQAIAQALLDSGAFKFEGNYYFAPDKVQMDNLTVTDRIYTCPYKGFANWIDLQTEQGVIKDVAWVYPTPKPGYEQIAGHIGFYDGIRSGTEAVKTTQPQALSEQ
jgi:uncharacterized protein (DUF427 family)